MSDSKQLTIEHLDADFEINALDSAKWERSADVEIIKYWSGVSAPSSRHFKARSMWSDTALYVRFEANQNEPLVINPEPILAQKTIGLWDRDVCEIFIAPDTSQISRYFEFEIAPTGEWVDLGIKVTPAKRETDWDYASGMHSAVKVDKNKVMMAIKIPWTALGKTPDSGDVWLGNFFRCVGSDPYRGYLAWQPTMTLEPNFHVPEKFGEFVFV